MANDDSTIRVAMPKHRDFDSIDDYEVYLADHEYCG
jgi:hypothetical protein